MAHVLWLHATSYHRPVVPLPIAAQASRTRLASPALSGWPGAQLLKPIAASQSHAGVADGLQTNGLRLDVSTRLPASQKCSQLRSSAHRLVGVEFNAPLDTV